MEAQLGTSGCAPSSSVGSSARIQRLMQQRRKYASELEFEIASSTEHWSELSSQCLDEELDPAANQKLFESLRSRQPSGFFGGYGRSIRLGQKIGEGVQAEIYEDAGDKDWVYKVFKQSHSLHDLEQQWPHGMLQTKWYKKESVSLIYGGLLLRDGRFAFRQWRCEGDLRRLIDRRMQENKNQSPPFSNNEIKRCMLDIALGMKALHSDNIMHRDLKASNVLYTHGIRLKVADFECSVGILGTGFWRAPEILLAIRNRHVTLDTFTKEADVYSYAMTCYEILTGMIPFEGQLLSNYDIVLDGQRPELPTYIEPMIRKLLVRCWDSRPHARPWFAEVVQKLQKYSWKYEKWIYPNPWFVEALLRLKNVPSVANYKGVKGMKDNLFFFDHKSQEDVRTDGVMKNVKEAKLVVELCSYLLKQGYSHKQILIVTMYYHQGGEIQRLLEKGRVGVTLTPTLSRESAPKSSLGQPGTMLYPTIAKSPVNFQGDECDIVILSLAGSNSQFFTDGFPRKIAYFRIENRIRKALSKARMRLYIFGNSELLYSKSNFFTGFIDTIRNMKCLGSELNLCCQNYHVPSLEPGHWNPTPPSPFQDSEDRSNLPLDGTHGSCKKRERHHVFKEKCGRVLPCSIM